MGEAEKQIKELINKIRPYLQRDGGDVKFAKFEEGVVYVELLGACVGCASSDITLKQGIEAIILEEIPSVLRVEKI
ncbi:NifU family protein [Mycoplasmatota bacterium]|nr:NifU family protein [Mycoplasmatota bacterium]